MGDDEVRILPRRRSDNSDSDSSGEVRVLDDDETKKKAASPPLPRESVDDETEALLGSSDEESSRDPAVPADSYNLVYCVFFLLGMGTLLPWNFFISVSSFWQYKFRNVSQDANGTGDSAPAATQTELQMEFASYLAIASNIPNALCVILNAIFGQRFPLKWRVFTSLGGIILLFFVVTALARANSDSWQREYLDFTLILVVLINCCTAVFQGGIFGAGGKFPPAYMGALMTGQAVGGIFPALVDIAVISSPSISDQDVGFYCFITATSVLIVCFLCFSWARRTPFFRFYDEQQDPPEVEEESHRHSHGHSQSHGHGHNPSVMFTLHHAWQYCVSVYLVFSVTLAAFPAVAVLVEPAAGRDGTPWAEKYFTPVTCFLLFSVCDWLGRLLGQWILRPRWIDGSGENPPLLALAVVRILFIPAFMFCNASPDRRSLPVYFCYDWMYILFMTAFALSNGYLGNLCMLLGPKSFSRPRDQELAAMVMVAVLVLGTGSGSFLSYPLVNAL